MEEDLKKSLEKIASTIRQLSIEAVQKANSGHPGLPLGCAELGAFLYGTQLNHYPKKSDWINRDRMILSAGHGSMWLYSCLHLSGFDLSLDEIKRFRQLHSKTPGHPEYHITDGVESTTGPLGQGVANAVGQALGMKILAEKFNTPDHKIIDNKVYTLAGDGCLMEGINHEACGLAGHLQLNNLVVIFDSNKITLDGPLDQSGSEDVGKRFEAYGFDVYEVDGHDFDDLARVFAQIDKGQTRPVLVIAHTIIGKGSPNKEGTHKVHGSPLGEEELKLTKEHLGLPDEEFYIPSAVVTYFEAKLKKDQERFELWETLFADWKTKNPELAKEYEVMDHCHLPANLEEEIKNVPMKDSIAGRSASNNVIKELGAHLPFLYGGSADLSGSDKTMMDEFPLIAPKDFKGRNFKFGIREFGMGAVAAGLFQTGMILPYVGTFLTFSDYMRNAIRLAALSHYHVIYQFTHDSIFLGEDGPTHQSVEHLAALRAIPNLHVFRPADDWEVKGAWLEMLKYEGPSAIILSRQNLPALAETRAHSFKESVGRGAYIVKKERDNADFTLIATGSELSLALEVASALEKMSKQVRVVSMPCWELFERQDKAYMESVLGGDIGRRASIEAGVSLGWARFVGPDGLSFAIDRFGESAPAGDLAQEFGFNVDAIVSGLLASGE